MNNNIIRMQAEIEYNVYRICDLLQWTRDRYNQHLYDTAVEYLEAYFNHDNIAIKRLSSEAAFWSWFKGLWNARNQAYREEWDGLEDSIGVDELRAMYYDIHRSAIMTAEIAPPRCVYPKDFPTIKMEMA